MSGSDVVIAKCGYGDDDGCEGVAGGAVMRVVVVVVRRVNKRV